MKTQININESHFRRMTITILLILAVILSTGNEVFAQKMQVCGKVVDENDDGIPGANIVIKGTTNGTVTDVDGNFCIWVSCPDDVLVFSFVGFLNEEIIVGNNCQINVILVPAVVSLDEVVVIGYGSTVSYGLTGAPGSRKAMRSNNSGLAKVKQNNIISWSNPHVSINNEEYSEISENEFHWAYLHPLSTFSLDVDAASYSNVRRYLNNGQLPPADAVRIEEMVNYFKYDYPECSDEHPVSITTELSECPWNSDHKLLHIGIKGKEVPSDHLPPANLVFLLDVSGSMNSYNKLPLLKSAMKLLVNELRKEDRVAIVVYAGAAGLILKSTPGDHKEEIIQSVESLRAYGSTAGGAGIRLAYETAEKYFMKNGNNRVILATDGDFNVGVSNVNELETLIAGKRKTGIYLTCLGFGMGNYKDSKIETLADKGNGNYAYIDNIQEANKILVEEFGGTLFTIAKDAKIQVEFNPEVVAGYRLIGYENRLLKDEDFKDDTKDAGEIGAGHTVTALYEIIPDGVKSKFLKDVDPLKYKITKENTDASPQELLTIKFRYKKPNENQSVEMIRIVMDFSTDPDMTSNNYRFSAAVALFGMLLRKSENINGKTCRTILDLAGGARGNDPDGYRAEFIRLVKAVSLDNFFSSSE